MKSLRLQSAMEYLMTYGWAILIIAVVMIALFALGILGGSPLSTACLPQSGFQCSGVTYNHGVLAAATGNFPAGNAIMTVGQTTGVQWTAVNVFYVPQGTTTSGTGIPSSITTTGVTPGFTFANANVVNGGGGMVSGQIAVVSLGVPSGSTLTIGTSASGTIWAQYWTLEGGPYYAKMASINLKAS